MGPKVFTEQANIEFFSVGMQLESRTLIGYCGWEFCGFPESLQTIAMIVSLNTSWPFPLKSLSPYHSQSASLIRRWEHSSTIQIFMILCSYRTCMTHSGCLQLPVLCNPDRLASILCWIWAAERSWCTWRYTPISGPTKEWHHSRQWK